MKKPKTKKQLESWVLENFQDKLVTLNELTEQEAKAHLYEHMVAVEKMIGNAQKTIDAYTKIGYIYEQR
jgi:hypothetical protein